MSMTLQGKDNFAGRYNSHRFIYVAVCFLELIIHLLVVAVVLPFQQAQLTIYV